MVCISLGNKTDLCIDNDDRLCIQTHDGCGRVLTKIDLGLATELRIEAIQDYLGRLYAHAVPQPQPMAA